MPSDVFRRHFRFEKSDFSVLQRALQIPDVVTSAQGFHVGGLEALCICLKRLAYPNRLCDLQHFFGLHYSVISSVSNKVLDHIEVTFGHLLNDLTKHEWPSLNDLDELSQFRRQNPEPPTKRLSPRHRHCLPKPPPTHSACQGHHDHT
ncbi:hypothetical protein HPB49_002234 [Dermacentor silvarum]|uniref:Uncharacterized protein n=1 Tax=Dermacentor silvarum TaxID=543639 RepID=A0ACB8DLY5_DERSI|nr:hypothetical protein HPB49_002234 [Dermacentor silvarum]